MNNSAAHQLIDAGVISRDRWTRIGTTRDRDDIAVLRCDVSGVIFLETSEHITDEYYLSEYDSRRGTQIGETFIRPPRADDLPRRADLMRPLVRGKHWLDFGAGWGEVLRELSGDCSDCLAVEPSRVKRESMGMDGIRAVGSLADVELGSFQVASLFHVLEHLQDPQEALTGLRERMSANGMLVVEVPHARDALLTLYASDAFAAFTYWSQHLVLHTRQSLSRVIEQAGFRQVTVQGVQRYGAANHLHWLAQQSPGGQTVWPFLVDSELDRAYGSRLASIDATDTILAVARAD